MYKSNSLAFIATLLTLAIAGCGTNPKERGLSGGAIGAGTGAVVGAVTGLSVLQGAVIGAGVGAVVGAVTNSDQINLGSLSSGSSRKSGQSQTASHKPVSPVVKDVQASLTEAGYSPGASDGIAVPKTRSAVTAYQRDHGLALDGEPSEKLLSHIRSKKI